MYIKQVLTLKNQEAEPSIPTDEDQWWFTEPQEKPKIPTLTTLPRSQRQRQDIKLLSVKATEILYIITRFITEIQKDVSELMDALQLTKI